MGGVTPAHPRGPNRALTEGDCRGGHARQSSGSDALTRGVDTWPAGTSVLSHQGHSPALWPHLP